MAQSFTNVPEERHASARVTRALTGETFRERRNLLIIVDDEPFRCRLLALAEELGMDVQTERAAVEAILAYRASWSPHAIVLDQLMPRSEYYAATRALRSAFGVPVLAVSSETLSTDLIPEPGVLLLSRNAALAEIRRLAARSERGARLLAIGPLQLDPMACAATLNGLPLRLTPDEVSTLAILMEHEGSVIHRRTLVAAIGGIQRDLDPRIIDVHVVRLMVKLGVAAPVTILRSSDREGYVLHRREDAGDSANR